MTYKDFLSVLRPLYINDLDPRGLIEGQDYDILYESKNEVLYSVHTYDASRILASNNVEPEIWTKIPSWCGREEFTDEAHAFGHFDSEHGDMKPGAKWCISMQTSDKYWNQYNPNFHFFFWFRNIPRLGDNRKIAIGVYKSTWGIALLYNGADNEVNVELPSHITEAIENEKKGFKEKELNKLKSMFTLNPQTNRYDYDGDLNSHILRNFISENRDGFTINFGEVTGNFNCSELNLVSLKGAPQKIGGSFWCFRNHLTSLKGAPQEVGWTFDCSENQLISLEGAPQKVGKDFNCFSNRLTSLEGAPQTVGGDFDCQSNQLTSLEGAPTEVGGSFNCFNNQLTSLKGAPTKVGRDFNCSSNRLTSLEGAPQTVGKGFYCSWNQLTFLEGAPQKIGGSFSCYKNPNLHSLEGIGEVKGKIFKDF